MIRKANINDIEQLAVLFDAYRVFYKKKPNINAAKDFLSERINNNESVIFVYENNDKTLCGFTQLYPIFTSTNMKRAWLLNDLFVDSNYRGQQISVKLIEAAKELVIETNAYGFMLETDKSNLIGNKLYEKTGLTLDMEHNFYSWELNK